VQISDVQMVLERNETLKVLLMETAGRNVTSREFDEHSAD